MRDGLAAVWSSGLIFYGRLPATTAPEEGWYHFKARVKGLKLPEGRGVWTTVHSGPCVSSAPLLSWVTAFEATEEIREIEFDAYLGKGTCSKCVLATSLEAGPIPGRTGRRRGRRTAGCSRHRHRASCDGTDVSPSSGGDPGVSVWRSEGREVAPGRRSRHHENPAERRGAAAAGVRRAGLPATVQLSELKPYIELVHGALAENTDFAAAMRWDIARSCAPRDFCTLSRIPVPWMTSPLLRVWPSFWGALRRMTNS